MTFMRLRVGRVFAVFAALTLLTGCAIPSIPTFSQSRLKAIKAESQLLMATHPIEPSKGWADIPKNQWPPVIASLQPFDVTVYKWGVNIGIKPYFDGGWGYHIGRSKQELPMPPGCYWELSLGVFWHGPC
ncbi:hypothetical protein [Sphingomonas sp.]|uniref:hypothetical protein n=1 Tax=Sphingomonas sp. TaxID=28214 RepID=UPI003D6D239D